MPRRARDAKRAGMKPTLQRRLHALLMQAAIARAEEMQADLPAEAEAGSEAGEREEASDAETSSSSETARQSGRKRPAAAAPDSSDEEGAYRS